MREERRERADRAWSRRREWRRKVGEEEAARACPAERTVRAAAVSLGRVEGVVVGEGM